MIGKVKADPAQIEQVIMNLVVNARDAMPDGGRIFLETSNVDLDSAYADEHVSVKPGKYVMLAVSDTGVGMSQETIAHIFEPFYTTKESGSGTGLGLSTVYGIVKQSGGYIWVYSEQGQRQHIQSLSAAGRRCARSRGEANPAPSQRIQRGWETILLVEDEEAVRELIRTVLTENGYDVMPARDPAHAIKLAKSYAKEIHMLLTDMVMPGMSGRELADEVSRRRPGNSRAVYVRLYRQRNHDRWNARKRSGVPAKAILSKHSCEQKVREVLTPASAPK